MLTQKEQDRLKKYEEDLAMPRWKYILIYGLTFGVMLFILSELSDFIFDKKSFQWNSDLLISFFVKITFGGITFGWIMRWGGLKDYKTLKAKAG
jgi:hypothetical protein